MNPVLAKTQAFSSPFKHFVSLEVFPVDVVQDITDWLRRETAWKLTETELYEQYEFSLWDVKPSRTVEFLRELPFLNMLRTRIGALLNVRLSDQIQICAHKLVPDQTIRLHHDFIIGGETHRLLVQLNGGAGVTDGGLLMFFNSQDASDVSKVFEPLPNSAIGFSISQHSYHAVSTQHHGDRYTLVYSFFEKTEIA